MLMTGPAAKPSEAGIHMVFLLFGKGCKGGAGSASIRGHRLVMASIHVRF